MPIQTHGWHMSEKTPSVGFKNVAGIETGIKSTTGRSMRGFFRFDSPELSRRDGEERNMDWGTMGKKDGQTVRAPNKHSCPGCHFFAHLWSTIFHEQRKWSGPRRDDLRAKADGEAWQNHCSCK
jgi:hypothetical protein